MHMIISVEKKSQEREREREREEGEGDKKKTFLSRYVWNYQIK